MQPALIAHKEARAAVWQAYKEGRAAAQKAEYETNPHLPCLKGV